MSFVEWSSESAVQTEPAKPSHSSGFFSTITVSALSDTDSPADRTRHIEQTTMTGRRIWKTLKGQSGEAVWPPSLEAALLEGLKKYHQHTWRPALDRFPMRNRFISDYIFEVTGKRRTAKQVGSRLQQLKDTCRQERILRFLQPPTEFLAGKGSTDHHSDGGRNTVATRHSPCHDGQPRPTLTHPPEIFPKEEPAAPVDLSAALVHEPIHVFLSLDHYMWYYPTPATPFTGGTTSPDHMFIRLSYTSQSVLFPSLTHGSPSATFLLISPCILDFQSTCSVFAGDCNHPIYEEQVPLYCDTSLTDRFGPGLVYVMSFIPGFWSTLRRSDPTQYVIQQRIFSYQGSARSSGSDPSVITVFYRFAFEESDRQWCPQY